MSKKRIIAIVAIVVLLLIAGISVGVFDKMHNNSKAMLSIESVNCEEGTVNRIVINKEKAEKYGFRIIFE